MGSGRIDINGVMEDVLADHHKVTGPIATPTDLDIIPQAAVVATQHSKQGTTLIARGALPSATTMGQYGLPIERCHMKLAVA